MRGAVDRSRGLPGFVLPNIARISRRRTCSTIINERIELLGSRTESAETEPNTFGLSREKRHFGRSGAGGTHPNCVSIVLRVD